MAHVNPQVGNDDVDRGHEPRVPRFVRIAEHRVHRRDDRQLVQDLVTADVTSVKNQLDAGQRIVYRRSQQSVRVGDQAYATDSGKGK